MSSSQWQCHRCGRVGGFILLGEGLVQCSGCGLIHFVAWGGQLHPARFTGVFPKDTPVTYWDELELERRLGK